MKHEEITFRSLGHLRTDYLEQKFGRLQTDEVVVMQERETHIFEHHPADFSLFLQYGAETIANPDYVITDGKHAGTVFLIRKLPQTNLNVVIRIALQSDTPGYKNSVMTFYRIRDKNLQKLIQKTENELLYRKE